MDGMLDFMSFIGVIFLIINVVVIVYFFKIAKDVKKLRLLSEIDLKGEVDAVVLMLNGNKDEANELLKKSFISQCVFILRTEEYRSDVDAKIDKVIKTFVLTYSAAFDGITETELKSVYASISKLCQKPPFNSEMFK